MEEGKRERNDTMKTGRNDSVEGDGRNAVKDENERCDKINRKKKAAIEHIKEETTEVNTSLPSSKLKFSVVEYFL